MEDRMILGIDYRAAVARRLPLGAVIGAGLLAVTVALALFLPSYFKSRAVVLIEAQEIPQDLVRSLVTSFADQRIQVISQRVLTNSNLTSIIDKYGLYADDRQSVPLETVVEMMRADITVTPISAEVADPKTARSMQATIAFELAYESKSPDLAQRVANEIVSLFLNENLKQRSETSAETLDFLTGESEKRRKELGDLETKLAKFKASNANRLPELATLNLEMVNRAEQEVTQLQAQMRSLQEQRAYLESNLAQQKPTTMMLTETGQRILSPADRLKVAESDYASLTAVYGPSHPDVVSKRKEIDSLRAAIGENSSASELAAKLQLAEADYQAASKKYSTDHPDVKRLARTVETLRQQMNEARAAVPAAPQTNEIPDNPAYVQLQARLQATDADMQGLRSQIAEKRAKIAEVEERLASTPEVEREYRALMRDYEVAQAKYTEVLSKRQEAELASNLESKQRGERFTLIEPPAVPEEPSKPNRLAIVLLGVLLSAAAAVGAGAIAETVDDNIYGRAGVLRALGIAPLAVIPALDTNSAARKRVQTRALVIFAVLGLLAMALAVVHFFVIPLDVLVFRGLRKFGA